MTSSMKRSTTPMPEWLIILLAVAAVLILIGAFRRF